jgi:malate synthase
MEDIQRMSTNIRALDQKNRELTKELNSLKLVLKKQESINETLNNETKAVKDDLLASKDSIHSDINSTRSELQSKSETLNQTIDANSQQNKKNLLVLALVGVLLIAITAFILGRKISKRGDEVATLSAKADKLNEEIVSRLSSEMSNMQQLSQELGALANIPGATSESEQKLILTLADRITFMEMTLYKMDSSVRGHKQLSKSIKQMKDNLLASGYELVEMLGKDYNEGMRVIANFVEDEELPQGKQVITGIIKPQINYKGKMIQSAQITVSQNI